jgi:DUF1680 family protein
VCEDLFDDIAFKQMYITGGIGQSSFGESFSYDYSLPNDTVYNETCASIGLSFFARRMAGVRARGKYTDVLERALYNGVISGMSLDGESFFYVNPLEAIPEASLKDPRMDRVKIERQKWFPCACCPPNLARIVASLGSYIHSVGEGTVYTHLYIGSDAKLKVSGKEVGVKIETEYPWEGRINISFSGSAVFAYAFHVPGWCESFKVMLNDVPVEYSMREGYAYISREWRTGDKLTIDFDMPVTLVTANPKVREDACKLAVTRGPVVYCLEEADNGADLCRLRLGRPDKFEVKYEPNLLEGVTVISCAGKRVKEWEEESGRVALYRPLSAEKYENVTLRFIPYYAWANRGAGEMCVWVRRQMQIVL